MATSPLELVRGMYCDRSLIRLSNGDRVLSESAAGGDVRRPKGAQDYEMADERNRDGDRDDQAQRDADGTRAVSASEEIANPADERHADAEADEDADGTAQGDGERALMRLDRVLDQPDRRSKPGVGQHIVDEEGGQGRAGAGAEDHRQH